MASTFAGLAGLSTATNPLRTYVVMPTNRALTAYIKTTVVVPLDTRLLTVAARKVIA